MAEVATLTSTSAHAPPKAAPSAASGTQAAAQKTAELLAAWHALTPSLRDQPVKLEQPVLKASAAQKSASEVSGSSLAVDTRQAAQKGQALLDEWRTTCKNLSSNQNPSAIELSWSERLRHQISSQQGDVLLSKVTSLEYGR